MRKLACRDDRLEYRELHLAFLILWLPNVSVEGLKVCVLIPTVAFDWSLNFIYLESALSLFGPNVCFLIEGRDHILLIERLALRNLPCSSHNWGFHWSRVIVELSVDLKDWRSHLWIFLFCLVKVYNNSSNHMSVPIWHRPLGAYSDLRDLFKDENLLNESWDRMLLGWSAARFEDFPSLIFFVSMP